MCLGIFKGEKLYAIVLWLVTINAFLLSITGVIQNCWKLKDTGTL